MYGLLSNVREFERVEADEQRLESVGPQHLVSRDAQPASLILVKRRWDQGTEIVT
jgi:hypothetical protein